MFLTAVLLTTSFMGATIRTTVQVYVQQQQDAPQQRSFMSPSVVVLHNLRQGLPRLPSVICWFGLFFLGVNSYTIVSYWVLGVSLYDIVDPAAYFDRIRLAYNIGWVYLLLLATIGLCIPAIVVEGASPMYSFSRAWTRSEGHRFLILSTLLLIDGWLVRLAVGLTLDLKGVFHNLWVHDLVYATLHSFFMPIGWIVMTVLYLNVRIDREGCNREVLIRDLDGHGDIHCFGRFRTTYKTGSRNASVDTCQPVLLEDEERPFSKP
jgi:hypothetical protein